MSRKRLVPAAIIGTAFALTAAIIFATPQRLNYQGYITQSGLPMSGPATMEFRLFDADTGGAQLCSTNPQAVTVTRGRFNYEIGSEAGGCDLAAIDWAGSNVFLEVVVGGQTLTPRERVVPAAMSLNSDKLGGQAAAAFATASHAHDGVYIKVSGDTMTGALTVQGGFVTAGDITAATGTVTAAAFVGDGSGLTNLPVAGGAVAKTGDTMSGALTVNNTITATGTVTAPLFDGAFDGDGSALTSVDAATLGGLTTAAFASATHAHDADYVNISGDTMTGALTVQGGFVTAADITAATGTVTAAAFVGDGAGLTNLPVAGGDFMSDGSVPMSGALTVNNTITATGTVTAPLFDGAFDGDGSALTSVDAATLSGLTTAAFASATHAHDADYVNISGDTMTGALTVQGGIATPGNITAATGTVTAGAVDAAGAITGSGIEVTGNATAAFFIGDGSQLTNLPVAGGDFMSDGSVPMTGGLVAQNGIISAGAITAATSTITAQNFVGDGSGLTNLPAMGSGSYVSKSGDTVSGGLVVDFDSATATLHVKAGNAGGGSAAYFEHLGAPDAATATVYIKTDNINVGSNALRVENTVGDTMHVSTTGNGSAGYFRTLNGLNINATVFAQTNGKGEGFYANHSGSGLLYSGNQTGTGKLIILKASNDAKFQVDRNGAVFASGTITTESAASFGAPPNGYYAFGAAVGPAGYGFRDNAGTLEYKNSGGSWAAFSGGGGDFMANGSVPMTGGLTVGANTGADGYDVNFYGTYSALTGSRMFWDASKSAFRAGQTDGAEWDDASVGAFSFASGHNTTASGNNSTALGETTTASGNYSTAMGYSTTASGLYSTSAGYVTTASGNYSTAMGYSTTASGAESTSMGSSATASGDFSIAAGRYVAAGPNNHTFAFGLGVDNANRMTNNVADSLGVGFNSDVPTLFVGPASGIGTYGKVGIGTSAPAAALDVNGDISASGPITSSANMAGQAAFVSEGSNVTGLSFVNSGLNGKGAYFQSDSAGNDLPVVDIINRGSGNSIYVESAGAASATAAVYISTDNAHTNSYGLRVEHSGGGFAVYARNTGDQMGAGYFENTDAANTESALVVNTVGAGSNAVVGFHGGGSGAAGYFEAGDAGGTVNAVEARTLGDGDLIYGKHSGAAGHLIRLDSGAMPSLAVDRWGNFFASGTIRSDSANSFAAEAGGYMNFGAAAGSVGYGFRDNAGTLEYKNDGGGWLALGGGGGDFMSDGSVPMTGGLTVGANTGTDGYDVNFYGTYAGLANARVFWDASKSAFRAGRADGAEWSDANVGSYSFANGFGTTASGGYSTAMGAGTIASGIVSTAIGDTTTASGGYSTAMGANTTASGDYSIAAGQFVAAGPNANAVAIGKGVDGGNLMTNNIINSLGIGFNSTEPTLFVGPASGAGTYGKVGIGTTTPATTLDVQGEMTVGKDTGTDGYDLNFYGTYYSAPSGRMFWDASKEALRIGRDSSGTFWSDANVGANSFVAGYDSQAAGFAAAAIGRDSTADGNYSIALGNTVTADGFNSTAIGNNAVASGDYSIAIGQYVTSPNSNSIALGLGVSAFDSLVNNIDNSLMVGFNSTVPTFFVGPGSGAGTYGNVGIRTTTPATSAALEIAGTDGALLLPRLTTAQQGALTGVDGMLIYNSETNKFRGRENGAWSDFGGGDFMANGSVPMTGALSVGANTGADGYDINFYGTYGGLTGSRMFWDASKSAFRAGQVDGAQWDDANVGDISFASGHNTTASGNYSTAMGVNTIASENYSTAMGAETTASGGVSTAMGSNTTASGGVSTAMGEYTTASGDYSIAAGQYVTAGPNANTVALGTGVDDSNRMTNNTINSLGIGFNSTVPTFFVGPGSGIGTYGKVGIGTSSPATTLDVQGELTTGQGTLSDIYDVTLYGVAEGVAGAMMFWNADRAALRAGRSMSYADIDTGEYSVALGRQVTASGEASVSLGYSTNASNQRAVALGSMTTASGQLSTAMGNQTIASGGYSTAIGDNTEAAGGYSMSIGSYSTANTNNSITLGRYLESAVGSEYSITLGNGAGNATRLVNSMANSLMVGFDSDVPTLFVGPASGVGTYGSVGIGTTGPTYMLEVNGSMGGKTLNLTNTAAAGDVLAINSGTGGNAIEIQSGNGSTDPSLYVYNMNNAKAAEFYTNNTGSSNESVFVGTNSNQASGYAMLIRHAGTGAAALRVYSDGTSSQPVIEGENVNGTGPLLRLRQAGADKLIVNNNGGIVTTSAPATPEANAIYGPLVPKAWARFYGTAGSVTTTSAYNVASVTSASTGNYVINLNRAFADTNYVVMATAVAANTESWNCYLSGGTANSVTVSCRNNGTLAANSSGIHVVMFGHQ